MMHYHLKHIQKASRILPFTILIILLTLISVPISTPTVHAQTPEELRSKIAERNSTIKDLEAEIKRYQEQIAEVGKTADSLKRTLAELDLTQKKLATDIKVTQAKIEATTLEIKELQSDISNKTENIKDNRLIIAQSLNKLYESGNKTLIETILQEKSLSKMLSSVDNLAYLQYGVKNKINDLEIIRTDLENTKTKTEKKKTELLGLNSELTSQKKIIADNATEKNRLLTQTKNTEANYKKQLADKVAKKEAFEKEILAFESALKLIIDPSKIPTSGKGILDWPLVKVTITQYFGNTAFSTANPQIYNGKGHTGIDLAASVGTPVHSALSGTVIGVANTDIVSTCYSYGKWIMVKHPNGLSTLYAHLSLQNVNVGDEVSTGQIIGYSGNTGYSTGPHLHFGVYATEGVQITKLQNSVNCRGVTIPLADLKAYLNPLSFL